MGSEAFNSDFINFTYLKTDTTFLHYKIVLQLMKAAVPAESYVIHLSSASLVSCDVYGQ